MNSSPQDPHQQQQQQLSSNGTDEEILSLSLSACEDDAAAAVSRHNSGVHVDDDDDDETAAARASNRSHFESSMESFAAANGLSTSADGATAGHHHGHDDLTPLAMPSSPSLLPLPGSPTSAGMHVHHHHAHHQMHQVVHQQQQQQFQHHQHHHEQQQQQQQQQLQQMQHQLQQQQHAQQQAQAQARQNQVLAMNILGSGGLADSNSVQSYFQHDPEGALAASMSHFTREFGEMQKTSAVGLDDGRRLAEDIGAKLEGQQPEGKKRKAASNVSIDLQTKIRLIELAEEYRYDPKATGRVKHEGVGGGNAGAASKDQMSGIRLAAQFGLNKSTVSRILKRKDEFKKAYYKDNISGGSKHINKKSKFEKLNRLVENWFDMTREKKMAVSDTLIRDVGKKFAEELGIDDFRGSNGWVRSLRNRKEHQARNMSVEAMEREKIKKDAEAIERMRAVFPNGMKDMAGFFKDLSTFLEKDCGGIVGGVGVGLGGNAESISSSLNGGIGSGGSGIDGAVSGYTDLDDDDALKEEEKVAEEFLRKKMVESLRAWSHELMESELSRLKKRLKPRQIANL
ncbi:Tigger transposable element-derived protein 6-like [Globisporangium polare]